jgi:RHS repeat-associated protein
LGEYYYAHGRKLVKHDPDKGLLWYYTDHLGSTRLLELGTQQSDMRRDYYPFGEAVTSSGDEESLYQFTGKEKDSNTGLFYFGARYYDPGIGRFISVDPLADENDAWSPYSYSKDNPINRIDPDGRNDLLAQLMAFLGVEGHRKSNEYSNFASSRIVIPKAGIDQSGAETFADALQFLDDSAEQFQQNAPEATAEFLGEASQVTGVAAAGCYGAALLTAPVPPVSTAFATTGVTLDGVSTGTAVGKAILTRETPDIAEAGASLIGNRGAGSAVSNILKNVNTNDDFLKAIIRSSIQLPKQIITTSISQTIQDSDEEKDE